MIAAFTVPPVAHRTCCARCRRLVLAGEPRYEMSLEEAEPNPRPLGRRTICSECLRGLMGRILQPDALEELFA